MNTKRKLILLVHNNSELRKIYVSALEEQNFEVVDFESPVDVKDILKSRSVDLILAGLATLNQSGFEFLREVRENPRLRSIPFIFVTNLNSGNLVKLAYEYGVDDYWDEESLSLEEFTSKVRDGFKGKI